MFPFQTENGSLCDFLNPLTVCSLCKCKFVVCLFFLRRNKRKLSICKQTKQTKWTCPSMLLRLFPMCCHSPIVFTSYIC